MAPRKSDSLPVLFEGKSETVRADEQVSRKMSPIDTVSTLPHELLDGGRDRQVKPS